MNYDKIKRGQSAEKKKSSNFRIENNECRFPRMWNFCLPHWNHIFLLFSLNNVSFFKIIFICMFFFSNYVLNLQYCERYKSNKRTGFSVWTRIVTKVFNITILDGLGWQKNAKEFNYAWSRTNQCDDGRHRSFHVGKRRPGPLFLVTVAIPFLFFSHDD